MAPLMSLIVPVYNVKAYLRRCMDSLTAPCGVECEIILVDDGSTDGSGPLCDAFADLPGVRVIHKGNGGLSSARNAGMDAASGDYLIFIDSDDYLVPGALDAMAAPLLAHRPDMVRYGYKKVLSGQVTGSFLLPYAEGLYQGAALEEIRLDTTSNEYTLDYGKTRILSAWAAAFRRAWLEAHRLRFVSEREILNEDYLFNLQAVWAAERFYVSHSCLYCYDYRPNSLSTVYRKDMMARKRNLFAGYEATVPGDDPETARRLDNFYIDCVYDAMTNEATSPKPAGEAIAAIRELLNDPRVQEALARNRDRAVTKKTKCICFLMRRRMAAAMYWGYRWTKKLQAGA